MGKEYNQQYGNNFIENQPELTKSLSLSKDGKWLIIKTIRTDILHVNYLKKVFKGGFE